MSDGKLLGRLRGHKDSVCCVRIQEDEHQALTSSEDGSVCAFDLRAQKLAQRLQVADGDAAVPSLALHPTDSNRLFCCSDAAVCELDRRQVHSIAVSSLRLDQTFRRPNSHKTLDPQGGGTAGAAVVRTFEFNTEEVNCVAVNEKGTLLAAADDSGQAAVIDLAAGSLVRLLRKGHANIASSVAFRPNHPWEVLTGGLDAAVIRWDFSGGRPLRRWNLEEAESGGGREVCNPPLVHCVATPGRGAERVFGRLFAAACGDGSVAVIDAEPSPGSGRKGGPAVGAAIPPGRPLLRDAEAHAAAANCVSFADAGRGAVLCSGGNDGRVLLQDWTRRLEDGSPFCGQGGSSLAERVQIAHGRKVNCVAVCGALDSVLVADVSRTVSLYRLR